MFVDTKIEYLVMPVVKQEIEVMSTFELAVKALQRRDQTLLASAFGIDAVITLLTKTGIKLLTRNEYIEKMREIFMKLSAISYKDVFIQLRNDIDAVVTCICVAKFTNVNLPDISHRHFTFQKRDGIWRIVRLDYADTIECRTQLNNFRLIQHEPTFSKK